MSFAGYMVDISDPQGWDFTGTSVIPEHYEDLPRASAFYIGGNTPHVWTAEQIARQSNQYRLPIWVYDPERSGAENGQLDAEAAIGVLKGHGFPTGKAVVLDMETTVDSPYSSAFANAIEKAGLVYVVYESDSVAGNHVGEAGRWYADWGSDPHTGTGPEPIEAGAFAKQYASEPDGHPFDISSVTSFEKFWDIKAAETPPEPVIPDPDPPKPIPATSVPRVIGATITVYYSDGSSGQLSATVPGVTISGGEAGTTNVSGTNNTL